MRLQQRRRQKSTRSLAPQRPVFNEEGGGKVGAIKMFVLLLIGAFFLPAPQMGPSDLIIKLTSSPTPRMFFALEVLRW